MKELIAETRQDLKEIKEVLNSIDKAVALNTDKLQTLTEKTEYLETRVDKIDDHVKFVNAVFRIVTIFGGVALFFVEILPLAQKLFR